MSSRPDRPHPAEVYSSFVRELALTPQAPDVLHRLRHGHQPDSYGWCRHPTHAHHWERHPCSTLRLADLVQSTDPQE